MSLAQRANVEEGERLLALEELHRRDLACDCPCQRPLDDGDRRRLPRMILQNIQAAIAVLNVLVL